MPEFNLLSESLTRIFTRDANDDERTRATDNTWENNLILHIKEAQLDLAMIPEGLGGYGLTFSELAAIARLTGEFAITVPIVETIVANWVMSAAGLREFQPWTTFGPGTLRSDLHFHDFGLTGTLNNLAVHSVCNTVVLLTEDDGQRRIVLVDIDGATVDSSEALDHKRILNMSFDQCRVRSVAKAPSYFSTITTVLLGSTIRSLQIVGALHKIMNLTLDYIGQRQAFGRSLSRFQVIQHDAAQLAEEVAIAESAATSAVDAIDTWSSSGRAFDDLELVLEVLSAKIRVSEAAAKICSIAHQLHGAIGYTKEYSLSRFTLAVSAWCEDYGHADVCSRYLGERIMQRGSQELWPLLAAR